MFYNDIEREEKMPDLYILETCPYCRKVMDFFEKNKIKYEKKDISNPENLSMLMKIGGKQQVPFLDDKENNITMYESDEIIEYMKSKV